MQRRPSPDHRTDQASSGAGIPPRACRARYSTAAAVGVLNTPARLLGSLGAEALVHCTGPPDPSRRAHHTAKWILHRNALTRRADSMALCQRDAPNRLVQTCANALRVGSALPNGPKREFLGEAGRELQ